MAANINRVVLLGNLTRDPELRHTPSGTAVCSLRIAVNTRRKDGATGEWTEKPNYFDVTVWGNQGENCAQYLAKGRPVAVDGRLEWREWDAQDGTKRQAVEIIADSVQFLGSRGDGEGGGQPQFVPVAATAQAEHADFGAGHTAHCGGGRAHDHLPSCGPRPEPASSSGAAAGPPPARFGRRTAGFAGTRSTRWTGRTRISSGATSPRRERSARAGSPAPAGATSARLRSPSSGRVRWRCCRTSPRAARSAWTAAATEATVTAETASADGGDPPRGRRQGRPAG